MNEIASLVEISKYAGERFDLVQAGGGNSSVKLENEEMLIKASGFLLSDVTTSSGYSKVSTKKIANIVENSSIITESSKRNKESKTSQLVKEATRATANRPSIETLLHSLLYKYTLHTHPIVVNILVVRKDWVDILNSLFGEEKIAIVEYKTPGIELALTLNEELHKFDTIPNIIFLQNHGLIVTSPHQLDIERLTEKVVEKIENYLKIDMSRYKVTNKISYLLKRVQKSANISYLSEDCYLNEQLLQHQDLFFYTPFCPDSLVYCGISCCRINNLLDIESLEKYKEKYFELPKVIIFDSKLFFVAPTIKKAKEMEEVFKFHIMVLEQNMKNDINFLDVEELAYLSNWEAEQYRQKI